MKLTSINGASSCLPEKKELSEEQRKRNNGYCRTYWLKNIERIRKRQREYQRRWRKENPELAKKRGISRQIKERPKRVMYSKKYYQLNKNKPEITKVSSGRSLRYYYNNPLKAKARTTLSKAILRGKLSKGKYCMGCFCVKKLEAHHIDYSLPLQVIWLCHKCHRIAENIKNAEAMNKKLNTCQAQSRILTMKKGE